MNKHKFHEQKVKIHKNLFRIPATKQQSNKYFHFFQWILFQEFVLFKENSWTTQISEQILLFCSNKTTKHKFPGLFWSSEQNRTKWTNCAYWDLAFCCFVFVRLGLEATNTNNKFHWNEFHFVISLFCCNKITK